MQFLDVATLVEKKQVNKEWKELCAKAIVAKCKSAHPFQSNKELKEAVEKYCQNDPLEVDQLACTYGYPIDKWNVSQVTDFSYVFFCHRHFNESISAWDTSNATTLQYMFSHATSFNFLLGTSEM